MMEYVVESNDQCKGFDSTESSGLKRRTQRCKGMQCRNNIGEKARHTKWIYDVTKVPEAVASSDYSSESLSGGGTISRYLTT